MLTFSEACTCNMPIMKSERSRYEEQYAAAAHIRDNHAWYCNKIGLYQRPLAEIFLCFHQQKCILQHEAAWLYIGMLHGNARLACKQQERCLKALLFGCVCVLSDPQRYPNCKHWMLTSRPSMRTERHNASVKAHASMSKVLFHHTITNEPSSNNKRMHYVHVNAC